MKKFLSLLLLIVLSGEIQSQVKIHRNLRVEDGLLQSTVNSICEDSDGYLWFGTESGISRWDGLNFYNYQRYEGLTFSGINFLEPLTDGSMVMGAHYGIDKFKNGDFRNVYLVEDNKFILDLEIVENQVWAATTRGIFQMESDTLKKLNLSPEIDTSVVNYIHNNKHGIIFIALRNKIITYSNNKLKDYQYNSRLPSKWIHSIYTSSNNELYINTDKGVMIEKKGEIKYLDKSMGLSNDNISDLIEGDDGIIYIGTAGGGLNLYSKGRIEKIFPENGLQDKFITALYKGSDGTIYIGTSSCGVYLHKNKQFVTYNEDVGLHNNFIMAITQDDKGAMYFGSMSEGLSVLENNRFKVIKPVIPERENGVLYLKRVPNGDIMIVNSMSVQFYNPHSKKNPRDC